MEEQIDSPRSPVPEKVVFKKPMRKGRTQVRKAPAKILIEPAETHSTSSSDSETEHRPKRRRLAATAAVSASSKDQRSIHEEGDTTLAPATRDTDFSRAARDEATKQAPLYDKSHDPKRASPRHARYGPVKAPTNIRTITTQDFQADVCKDFKKSGFCGFGDNCKFLHTREDYKQGWQLDQDWEKATQGRAPKGTIIGGRHTETGDDDETNGHGQEQKGTSSNCVICEQTCQSPVVTRCGHCFCEGCALKRYRRDPTCATCGVKLDGVFKAGKAPRRQN